jgi:hypothetical protein
LRERPVFSARASQGRRKATLAIGLDSGVLVAYIEEGEGRHTEVTILYSGSDGYELWRAYMTELARLERENWAFSRRDVPRPSEVRDLDKSLRA